MATDPEDRGGIGLCGCLFILFLALKLTGWIHWSWWWVFSPLWIPATLWLGAALLVLSATLFIGAWLMAVDWWRWNR